MFTIRKAVLWLSIGCAVALAGCIGSPEASKSEERVAKTFVVKSGKSSIYIYRDTIVAAIQTFRLYLDGNLLGDSRNRSFFLQAVEPGSHSVMVTNVRNQRLDELDLHTEAGKAYYVELKIKPNPLSGIPALRIAKQKEAQGAIRECDMLQAGRDALSP